MYLLCYWLWFQWILPLCLSLLDSVHTGYAFSFLSVDCHPPRVWCCVFCIVHIFCAPTYHHQEASFFHFLLRCLLRCRRLGCSSSYYCTVQVPACLQSKQRWGTDWKCLKLSFSFTSLLLFGRTCGHLSSQLKYLFRSLPWQPRRSWTPCNSHIKSC